MSRLLSWKWSASLGFLLILVAYHAGAVYFGMPWRLFFLGVMVSAWVFSMVVVAHIFDRLSPPRRASEFIGVGRAILVGEIVVNMPALGLMLVTMWLAGPVVQGWIEGGESKSIGFLTLLVVMTLALGAGWLWWSIVMPRWRVWALERVCNPQLLYRAAVSAQLMWPTSGRLAFLNRTEWKTARLSLREQAALQRHLAKASGSISNT